MKKPPETQAEALEIRDKAMSNPLLKGTVISEDGKAICLYLPLTSKDLSHDVYKELTKKMATFEEGDEEYHITGLPVAEDTFGVEMFIQMAISAPLAMAVIFILMLLFFRKLVLVISPMIVAMVSVISTMGLLIGFGYPVHIMSSMIPIFLMPIAVVDSVHILSEFFDLYTKEKGQQKNGSGGGGQFVYAYALYVADLGGGLCLFGPDADSAGPGIRRVRRHRHYDRVGVYDYLRASVHYDDP